jgi:hypothetical protein
MLLMLEDDAERLHRFQEVARALDPNIPIMIWRNAKVMIREVTTHLPNARLISLDHDLEPDEDGSDPGDGLEIAKFLASQPIVRPVIIHSSNRLRSDWMAGEFELAGWPFGRVAPIGDDWIEVDWRCAVKNLIARSKNEHR